MPREKDAIDEWIDLIKIMPWWLNFILALLIYFGLHFVSQMKVPSVDTEKPAEGIISTGMYSVMITVAWGLKYVIPLFFALGGVITLFKKLFNMDR